MTRPTERYQRTWSSLPLFPTDEGWPYPDATEVLDIVDDSEIDLDALELRVDPHAFDTLTPAERDAVVRHFGLDGSTPLPMKKLAPELGCTRAQARERLGSAIDKLRTRLTS
jgi:DNA-directed RNA polymerase sigma subunit (sigma70/sigma32)